MINTWTKYIQKIKSTKNKNKTAYWVRKRSGEGWVRSSGEAALKRWVLHEVRDKPCEDLERRREDAAGSMVMADLWSGNELELFKRTRDNVAWGAHGTKWKKRPEGHREAQTLTALGIKVWIILKSHAELRESLSQIWSDSVFKKNTRINWEAEKRVAGK